MIKSKSERVLHKSDQTTPRSDFVSSAFFVDMIVPGATAADDIDVNDDRATLHYLKFPQTGFYDKPSTNYGTTESSYITSPRADSVIGIKTTSTTIVDKVEERLSTLQFTESLPPLITPTRARYDTTITSAQHATDLSIPDREFSFSELFDTNAGLRKNIYRLG